MNKVIVKQNKPSLNNIFFLLLQMKIKLILYNVGDSRYNNNFILFKVFNCSLFVCAHNKTRNSKKHCFDV